MQKLADQKCVPCEGGIPPMNEADEEKYLSETKYWILDRSKVHKLHRNFEFEDFLEAMQFVNKVADLAENEGHHPDFHIYWNKVNLELYTHAVKGLSLNDFILASKINRILGDFKSQL